jgi:hypothetical protein
MWHIDTAVIRLLDGTRAYLHAVIDNFSRRILAWRMADTFASVNSLSVLLDASRTAAPSDTTPVVLADAGVENVNAQVDALIQTGVLRRLLAFTELKFSNSMIEARRRDEPATSRCDAGKNWGRHVSRGDSRTVSAIRDREQPSPT